MSEESEPWNNSYVLDGETETLLRRLLVAPLTRDQIVRACLKDVHLLLGPDDRARLESKMADGAGGLLGLALQPFSNAVAAWQQLQDQVQQTVDWKDVPAGERALSEKRASYILEYATSKGWVVGDPENGAWQITELGRDLVQRGGFYLR